MLRPLRPRALALRRGRSKLKRCEAPRAAEPPRHERGQDAQGQLLQRIATHVAGAFACLSVLLAPSGACAAELTLQFKASPVPEIRDAQTRLVQSYAYVKYYYVDDSFNGLDWDAAYQAALEQSYGAETGDEVDAITTALLKRLGDPFTRLLSPQASRTYKAEKQGAVRSFGIGIDCSAAASAGSCALDYVQAGSAAAEAGLRTGDQVVAFQQQPIDESSGRDLKQALQQRDRDGLQLSVRRDAPAAVASDDAEFSLADDAPVEASVTTVTLQQRAVDVNPVQFATVPLPSGDQAAYVRLAVFADNASKNVEAALQKLDSSRGLVLDLRDNPGGTVGPGLDIAGTLLPNGAPFVSISGREMNSERIAVSKAGSRPAITKQPMVVLVNNNTASTSEMLASALRAKGATLVGDTTLGKGRTQQVFELPRGELLFVSVLKYKGAAGETIDRTGLRPDRICAPEATGQERYTGGSLGSSADLRDDPCISLAVDLLADRATGSGKAPVRKQEVVAEVAETPGTQRSGAAETERREKEAAEQARRDAERREAEKEQSERAAAEERTESARREEARASAEQAEANERKDRERAAAERQEEDRRETERKEQERAATVQRQAEERKEAERKETERKEAERKEQERAATAKREAEERKETERKEQERAAIAKREAEERKGAEKREEENVTRAKKEADAARIETATQEPLQPGQPKGGAERMEGDRRAPEAAQVAAGGREAEGRREDGERLVAAQDGAPPPRAEEMNWADDADVDMESLIAP